MLQPLRWTLTVEAREERALELSGPATLSPLYGHKKLVLEKNGSQLTQNTAKFRILLQ